MKSLFEVIVSPAGGRYNNSVAVDNKELIVNTEIYNHSFVNRIGVVMNKPTAIETDFEVGDEVVVHHNLFRRWLDMKGREKNSRGFIGDNMYTTPVDQIFAYRTPGGEWKPQDGYCFVEPIKTSGKFEVKTEATNLGVLRYVNEDLLSLGLSEGDLIGFSDFNNYEFMLGDEKLFRVISNQVNVCYGRYQ